MGDIPPEDLLRDLDTFGHYVAEFLSGIAGRSEDRLGQWGMGADTVNVVSEFSEEQEKERVVAARSYLKKRFEAGLAWITGPVEYGGAGLTHLHDASYREIESAFDLPDKDYTVVGTELLAPVLFSHGTERAKSSYLRAIHRGDHLVCQLFSEPDAGSDLAAVTTLARPDGDDWRVSGRKVWSSGARHADLGVLLVRTDSQAAKHRGLTAVLLDMQQGGVDVRPIRQMTGGSSFFEVFLDDVYVPGWHLLGEPGAGWSIASEILLLERAALGPARLPIDDYLNRLIATTKQLDSGTSPLVKIQIVDALIKSRMLDLTSSRLLSGSASGLPGPELAVTKLLLNQTLLAVSDVVSLLLGPALTADSGVWGTYSWSKFVLGTPGMRIGGGTEEILKSLIAERVLGLPREPKPAGLATVSNGTSGS